MAFSNFSGLSGFTDKTANQASTTVNHNNLTATENLVILLVAVDNNQTTDGDEGAVTSVTDTAGNVWSKAIEFCNGQGSAQAGATCSAWYFTTSNGTSALDTITVNFSNATSRDASVLGTFAFNYTPGNTVIVEATNFLANDGADPGSLNATTANIACLRLRAIAAETNSTIALTTTSGWTTIGSLTTSGGGATANMALRFEYIISTGTSAASDPTYTAADCASVYIAFKEVATTSWFQHKTGYEDIVRAPHQMIPY